MKFPATRPLVLALFLVLTAVAGQAAELVLVDASGTEKVFTHADLKALGAVPERLKTGSVDAYRGAFEVLAVPLQAVLDTVGFKKARPDGFNRELDMFVQVVDRSGRTALYSYGEIYLGNRKHQVLLTVGTRYLIPHKHAEIKSADFDVSAWSDFGKDLLERGGKATCGACHNGSVQPKLAPPPGYTVFAPEDVWHGRVLEDVVKIRIGQVPVDTTKNLKPQDKDAMWVENPVLILPDGKKTELTAEILGKVPRAARRDCSFCLGKGFHGIQLREGYDLAKLLQSHLAGADWRNLAVVMTCADGYRSTFSGGELFGSELWERFLLVDAEDGKACSPGGGKYKLLPQPDFYVDRALRSVAEIRCFVP